LYYIIYCNQNEFGPLEYLGHIDNKTTMGISPFTDMSSEIIYDPLLSWTVPLTWSLEEAATVPLSYAIVITH